MNCCATSLILVYGMASIWQLKYIKLDMWLFIKPFLQQPDEKLCWCPLSVFICPSPHTHTFGYTAVGDIKH